MSWAGTGGQFEDFSPLGLAFLKKLGTNQSRIISQGAKGNWQLGGRMQVWLSPQAAVGAHKEVQGPDDILSSYELRPPQSDPFHNPNRTPKSKKLGGNINKTTN